MTPKERYQQACIQQLSLPLFATYNWWDAVHPNWELLMAEIDSTYAFLPYITEKKLFFILSRTAPLTPYLNVVFSETNFSDLQKRKLVDNLIQQYLKFDFIKLDMEIGFRFSDCFIQHNFFQTHRTTYLLPLTTSELVYKTFKPPLQRRLKRESLFTISENGTIAEFYDLYTCIFNRQQIKPPVPFQYFERAWKFLSTQGIGKLFFATNNDGHKHTALLLIYYNGTAYYMASGRDTTYSDSDAMPKLMWHAIKYSIENGCNVFDFEGSDIPQIAQFFKNFSPQEVTYSSFKKYNSILLKWIKPNL